MTSISENISLKPYNTFGIDAKALFFAEIKSLIDLFEVLDSQKFKNLPKLFLGGGSNILFTKDFDGLVVKNNIQGIEVIQETPGEVWVKASSGVVWHDLVLYCISKNYGGIENLSLIPGTVGAAPIQNIGAYGVELKDVFDSLIALDLNSLQMLELKASDCRFAYRDSIFKQEGKDKYFIATVTLKLNKNPIINTSYGAIQKLLDSKGITNPTITAVSKVVCEIRNSKLPNPAVIGNAGSFFKNPEISNQQYENLVKTYPDMPGYITENGIKLPAGLLIESCGWKGKRIGETGSHKDQALVLVNYGHANGTEVKKLAENIVESVEEKFGIQLNTEVNII